MMRAKIYPSDESLLGFAVALWGAFLTAVGINASWPFWYISIFGALMACGILVFADGQFKASS